jgi:Ca-activated chloride channel family protein
MGMSDLYPVRDVRESLLLRLRWIVPLLKYTALSLMIVALARPQIGTRRVVLPTEGINIILAVDLSESMAALDFRRDDRIVNRLDAVRKVVQEFVGHRSGDRIGLVVFGTEAYTQLPLTRDYTAINTVLERLEIGAAGGNTAVGDAIGISLKRLEDIKSRSNLIILLTDGQSNAGELSPEAAARLAADSRVKIYTVGVGTRGEAPFRVKHPILGERTVYRRVDIDEDSLKRIAAATGGRYFRAENSEELESIYALIDQMEKTEVKVKAFAENRELYPWLLVPAFGLLVAGALLSNTRFLRVP